LRPTARRQKTSVSGDAPTLAASHGSVSRTGTSAASPRRCAVWDEAYQSEYSSFMEALSDVRGAWSQMVEVRPQPRTESGYGDASTGLYCITI